MDIQELRTKLAKVEEELRDLSSAPYSQSDPSRALGLRSLRRIRERLLGQIEALTNASKT